MKVTERYIERFKKFTDIKDRLTRKSSLISTLRLVVFIGGIVVTVLVYKNIGFIYSIVALFASIIFFLYLVIMHQKVIDEVKRFGNLAEINRKCICRMDGSWTDFSLNGESYKNTKHNYSNDLDIFGNASLFQWINTTNTYYGSETLKNLLINPDKNSEYIKKRQGAIKELSKKMEFCQNIECEGMDDEEISKDPKKILTYCEDESKIFKNKWFEWIFYILPEVSVLFIIIHWFDKSVSLIIPIVLLALHIIINLLCYNKLIPAINNVAYYKKKIKVFQKIIKLIEDEELKDEYLLELKNRLFSKNQSASSQIKDLEKIVGAMDMRYSPVFAFLSNILLFWDFHCVFAVERWKAVSGKSIRTWIETIGVFEALSSLALISQMNPQWTYAVFSENKVFFSAEKIGHPLIHNDKRVCNSIKIDNEISVVTGSNMSGKTTFLRTVGINLVLAYAGAAVCAERFETSIMDIYTSMRITDDLSAGISTFYAELLRIKMIIDSSRKKENIIFLIDEVFRGTNSEDRITGAKNVIINLDKSWIIGLISTHDFELCNLENDKNRRIANYHFSETYSKNEIRFDYLLKPGRCRTTNAKYLMRMVGIEIMEETK